MGLFCKIASGFDRSVLSYVDIHIDYHGRRDQLASPYRLEPLQLVQIS
jgi:hypothetical protein